MSRNEGERDREEKGDRGNGGGGREAQLANRSL